MFGWKLERDEWAVALGIIYLVLRVLYGLARILRYHAIKAPPTMRILKYLPLVTGAAVAAIAVGLVSIAFGGQPLQVHAMVSTFAGVMGFFLGIMFDVILVFRLHALSLWLAAFRVPQYREELLSGDDAVRLAAAERLAGLGSRARPALPDLLVAMRDTSADVRAMAAAAAFWATPDPPPEDDRDAPAASRVALADPDLRVRTYAAVILVKYRATPAGDVLPALTEGLKHGTDAAANVVAWMLERLGPEAAAAIPALREAALQRKPSVIGAARALGAIGPPVVPLLIEILEIGEQTARWEAAEALGKMGASARPALPALRRLVGTTMMDVAAKQAIKKIDRAGE